MCPLFPSKVRKNDYIRGSISPNFFAKQKDDGERCLAKKLQFNFTNKLLRLKFGQNSPKYELHLPKGIESLAHTFFCAQMLMKLTPGGNPIE
jgi:hypothetical protein